MPFDKAHLYQMAVAKFVTCLEINKLSLKKLYAISFLYLISSQDVTTLILAIYWS